MEKSGRPLKYARLIAKLDPTVLYSAATIAQYALTSGYIRVKDPVEKNLKLRRIRTSCNRLKIVYRFPQDGDGIIALKQQHPQPAWYGKRWLEILKQKRKKKPRPKRK